VDQAPILTPPGGGQHEPPPGPPPPRGRRLGHVAENSPGGNFGRWPFDTAQKKKTPRGFANVSIAAAAAPACRKRGGGPNVSSIIVLPGG